MVKKKENLDNDDLWGKITKTVNPIKSDKIPIANLVASDTVDFTKKTKDKKHINYESSDKLYGSKNPIKKVVKNTPSDLRDKKVFGIDASSSKKLRTGKVEIDATLDLHGMTQQSAFSSTLSFIKTAVLKKHRTILIITGKGTEGRGVLRSQLPIWLKSEICAPHIVAFDQAQAKDGGSGAFYIRLRRDRQRRS